MGLAEILGLLGFSTAMGGTVSFFIQRYIKRRDRVRDEQAERQRTREREEQEALRRKTEELETQNKATMLGVQALLRDRLLQAFKHYQHLGFADYNDRLNLENMYVQYEALGPNSVMQDFYEDFKRLPTAPAEEQRGA